MHEFVFVLEQTIGHVAHCQNLARVVASEDQLAARFIRVEFSQGIVWRRVPAIGSWSFRASWNARRRLNHEIAARRPDCIFLHTQVVGLLATGVMRRIPTVVSLDATPLNFDRVGQAYAHESGSAVLEMIKLKVNRHVFRAAAGLVTWSEWAAASLRNDYGVTSDKIRVIPPGVDLRLFSPGARKWAGPTRVLFVGGDFERKGGRDLLDALRLLDGDLVVDIVTGSPVSAAASVPVRVHNGLRPQSPELVQLFREADIFVLPSRGDCLPQAIAEAMACGVPVVATHVGAIPELVKDGRTGLLVPPSSPRELAQALTVLIRSRTRRQAMGNAGWDVVRKQHDMRVNNRSILAYMSEVSHSRRLAVGIA